MSTLRVINNLPPRWNGKPVTWDGPQKGVSTIEFHATPSKCPKCERRRWTDTWCGFVTEQWPVAALQLYRCRGCGHDHVFDLFTNEWWDLDATDYGPEGSTDPRLF